MKQFLAPLASLKLTVVLMALSILLVFAGTLAQVGASTYVVEKTYFHSVFVWVPLRIFLSQSTTSLAFPMLGGYALGLLLLLNLAAALITTFRYEWKRIGVLFIHASLIILLVGEGFRGNFAVESRMTLDEGQSSSWTEDNHQIELALTDPSPADRDNVVVISGQRLAQGGVVEHPGLPFQIRVDAFYPNSDLFDLRENNAPAARRATHGVGASVVAVSKPPVSGAEGEMDVPALYLTPIAGGKELGTYLASVVLRDAQPIEVNGKTWNLQLRNRRYYKPYTIQLLDFAHDRYTGTDEARNFSSRVRLIDPSRGVDREVKIWMNHPLRYRGDTLYQSGFRGERTTILQVVSNPSWLIPYIACVLGGLGMTIHFGIHLSRFLSRRSAAAMPSRAAGRGEAYSLPARQGGLVLPLAAGLLGLVLAFFISRPFQPAPRGDYSLDRFATLPISFEGRVQPLDSVARNALKVLSQREYLRTDEGRRPAIQWLADLFARPEVAQNARIFRIDHPDLVGMLGLDGNRNVFALAELLPKLQVISEQYQLAQQVEPKKRDLAQRKIVELGQRLMLYQQLLRFDTLYVVPPFAGKDWRPIAEVAAEENASVAGGLKNPAARSFVSLLTYYQQQQPGEFTRELASYSRLVDQSIPRDARRARFEAAFNRFDPFFVCQILYVGVFILTCASWLRWTRPLWRISSGLLVAAFLLHTFGLVGRVYISGRPPVTNLASSAIFIAWGAVALAAGLERVYRNGIGSASAALIGFLSLLISHYLSLTGDTMKVLRAVLDTNFWLASHVVAITLGYSATFLAGLLGVVFVLRGLVTRTLDREKASELHRMTYGVVCFAMLFSFVGTVLGGIWADQSWGRFWGWDPKENGAALIVLFIALMLHARWAGLIRQRGFALAAIFGNIVTAWSWFGTNMLGVGLHSYGFMDAAFMALLGFVGLNLLVIALGSLPLAWWRSPLVESPSARSAVAEPVA